jgi:hypothetical protein
VEKKTFDYPIKIALLSGAIKNAGDYLIIERCKNLLTSIYPNCIITQFERLFSLENSLDDINKYDILIFGGGPGYIPNLYPAHMPLVSDLNRIKVPMFVLGMGWFGEDGRSETLYNYSLTGATLDLFKRVERDTKFLGCRDWFSVNVLRNSGISGGYMTGCPAWYDLNYVNQTKVIRDPAQGLKKICISDPASLENFDLALQVAKYIHGNLPNTHIKFIFHRGDKTDQLTHVSAGNKMQELRTGLEELGIECKNIAYGSEGFHEYDDCDLHIGFRVHAHIYNLSIRNISILIEEDGRGAGVNSALGLDNILAYEYGINSKSSGTSLISNVGHNPNQFLIYQLDDYINNLWNSNFLKINNAFNSMNYYYNQMTEHIKSIIEFV